MTLILNIQSAMASGVDAFMDKHVAPVSDAVARLIFYPVNICNNEVPLIIFWILIAGIFFIAGQHNGNTISLSRKQIKKYRKILSLDKDKDCIDYLKAKKVKPEQLIRFEAR